MFRIEAPIALPIAEQQYNENQISDDVAMTQLQSNSVPSTSGSEDPHENTIYVAESEPMARPEKSATEIDGVPQENNESVTSSTTQSNDMQVIANARSKILFSVSTKKTLLFNSLQKSGYGIFLRIAVSTS